MSVLSEADIGPWYTVLPLLVAIYAVCLAAYFYKAQKNTTCAIVILAWFTALFFICRTDPFFQSLYFDREDSIWDTFGIFVKYNMAVGIPMTGLAYCWFYLKWFKEMCIYKIPAWVQIAFHCFRLVGAAYVYLWVKGIVPNFAMAYAGFTDLFITLSSIPLALYVRQYGLKSAKNITRIWSIIGISDIALAIGFFTLNYFGIYSPDTSLAIFSLYPFSIILLFNVELIIFKHTLFLYELDTLVDADVNQGINKGTPQVSSEGYTSIV